MPHAAAEPRACPARSQTHNNNNGASSAAAHAADAPPLPATPDALCAAEEARAPKPTPSGALPVVDADEDDAPPPLPTRLLRPLRSFWRKFHGDPRASPALRPALLEAAYAGASAGLAIMALAALHLATTSRVRLEQLIPPFGASAVLVFATPTSPLAQPRNLMGGNVLAAVVGVAVGRAFRGTAVLPWLAPGVAVGLSVLLMGATGCTHPPSGAMALAALERRPDGGQHSFLFVLLPAASGSALLLVLALLANNLHPHQRYPQRWW